MKIEKAKINELISPSYNPRTITSEALDSLKQSLDEFGYIDPLIVNKHNNHIVGGNQRYEVLKSMGYTEIPVIFIDEPDINREKMINIRLNNSSGSWEETKLIDILEDLELQEYDVNLTGFDLDTLNIDLENNDYDITDETIFTEDTGANPLGDLIEKYIGENNTGETGSLKRDYLQPPFSILKGNSKEWLNLKNELKKEINDKTESRENLICDNFGTSLFDPYLALLMLKWFAPKGECNIFDCFSGDSTIGAMSSKLNHIFTGIELRQEQVDLNNSRLFNDKSKYICDDGQNVLKHIKPETQDLLFSCPPYFDLEIYSDLPNDASNQETYEDFLKIIEIAFTNSIKCLKNNRFAVIVCGDIRDKKGFYYGFPQDIIQIFKNNGLKLYNEIILADPIGSSALRARKTFRNRKVVKIHQNILVFYKGEPQQIKENFILACEKED